MWRLGNEVKGNLQMSPKKTLSQEFFKERIWKSENLDSNSNAGTIYLAFSWTIVVALELCSLKPRFPWRCGGHGGIVRRRPRVSTVAILPISFRTVLFLSGWEFPITSYLNKKFSCFKFG